jgi:sulfatase maturation enzyme AslB (radical SAM superfamily)
MKPIVLRPATEREIMTPMTSHKIRISPSGIHIFDRASGLNVLFDEVRPLQSQWAKAPRQVSIALTNACDLACPFCFTPKTHSELVVEKVFRWLDDLDTNGCLGVGFGGGEPTLYPHLIALCRYAAQNTGLAITLTTHGHNLNDEIIAELTGSVHFVRVSMDGVGATYEALRCRSFVELCSRLEVLRSLAPFGINFVVNERTIHDLDAATLLAAELGAVEFLLLPEQPVEGVGGIDIVTSQKFRDWVCLYHGSVPLTVSENGADGLPTCNPFEFETGLQAYVHIDAAGILKRTSFDRDGVAIGCNSVMHAIEDLRTLHQEGLS